MPHKSRKKFDPSKVKPLICEKVVTCKVGYSDLERYIQEITGKYLMSCGFTECSKREITRFE
jgi:hypothetical protein